MSGLLELADAFDRLNAPDQGLSYENANHGQRRYDEITGKPYWTTGRPARLTVYGERANLLLDVIQKHAPTIAEALRARAAQESAA